MSKRISQRPEKPIAIIAIFALALSALAAHWSTGAIARESIQWYSYEEGMAIGKEKQKKILINFFADWCSYCKKMDKETYRNHTVADFMRDNFIAVKVDTERQNDVAEAFRVQGLPSTWFVAENGKKISNLPGFVPPEDFVNILKYIQTDSYQSMSYRRFLETL